MEHHRQQMTEKYRISIVGLTACIALSLSACDSGQSSGESDSSAAPAPVEEAAASATDEGAVVATEASAAGNEASTMVDYTKQVLIHRDGNGVPTGEITVGNPDAELEIIEYLSVTCSHCARHHATAWQDIKGKYVASGKVKNTFRMFARNSLDELISMLPLCGTDEQAYPMMDMIMTRQSQWMSSGNAQEMLNSVAALVRRAGMSRASFDACVRTQPLLDNIRATTRAGAEDDNVNATPTFLIGSERLSGSLPFESFVEVIEDEL